MLFCYPALHWLISYVFPPIEFSDRNKNIVFVDILPCVLQTKDARPMPVLRSKYVLALTYVRKSAVVTRPVYSPFTSQINSKAVSLYVYFLSLYINRLVRCISYSYKLTAAPIFKRHYAFYPIEPAGYPIESALLPTETAFPHRTGGLISTCGTVYIIIILNNSRISFCDLMALNRCVVECMQYMPIGNPIIKP